MSLLGAMFIQLFIALFYSEEAINRDAEMCNAAMETGNPQVLKKIDLLMSTTVLLLLLPLYYYLLYYNNDDNNSSYIIIIMITIIRGGNNNQDV